MSPKKSPRKSTQRGQLVPRGDNKFLCRVYLGRDKSGKRRYQSKMVTGRKAAGEQLTKMLRALDTNEVVHPTKETVEEFFRRWLEGRKGTLSPRTLGDYEYRLKSDVFPHVGSMKLTSLTSERITNLYSTLLSDPDRNVGSRSVLYTHAILRSALEDAFKWKIITHNPAARGLVRKPKKSAKKNIEVLTPFQVQ